MNLAQSTDRRYIQAEIHETRHEYIINYKDREYEVWSNLDGDEIVSRKPLKLPAWVREQLTDHEIERLHAGDMLQIKVPFEEIDYEIRERETGKMVKRPAIKNLLQGTHNHFRTEGGEIIEPDHPDSPLRKLGLI